MVFGIAEWMVSGIGLYLNKWWSFDGACVCACYVFGVWLQMDGNAEL